MKQAERVLKYMRDFGSITSADAMATTTTAFIQVGNIGDR